MTATDLVDRLAAHKTLGAAPREELAWLAAHGSLRQLNAGDVLTREGRAGRRACSSCCRGASPFRRPRRRAAQDHGMARRATSTGMLPYSRLVSPPGDTVAQEPSEILAVHRDHLRRDDPRVPRGHVDPRPHDARSRARLHLERPARREDGLARQAVRGTRARAEQPGVGDRAQRVAARGPAGGGRAGGARARRVAADRRAARGGRRRSRRPAWRRACTACGRRSSRPNARRRSPTGSPITALDAGIAGRAGRNRRDVRGARPHRRGRRRTGARTPRCGGPPPDARFAASPRRFRTPRCASRAWSRRSRASRTWIRPRSPSRWT